MLQKWLECGSKNPVKIPLVDPKLGGGGGGGGGLGWAGLAPPDLYIGAPIIIMIILWICRLHQRQIHAGNACH